MSIATWGEDPRGTWILDIFDEVRLQKTPQNFLFIY